MKCKYMVNIRNIEHVKVYKDPELAHACNQVSIVLLQNGELFLGFNEERYPIHADSGQSCFIKSTDGGRIWNPSEKRVIWPFTENKGNWDCAFAQISDGTILMHTRVCNFIAPRGINYDGDQSLGMPPPGMPDRTVQDMLIMAQYWHIGYPSATQLEDGTIITAYHEYSDDEQPIHYLMVTRFKV